MSATVILSLYYNSWRSSRKKQERVFLPKLKHGVSYPKIDETNIKHELTQSRVYRFVSGFIWTNTFWKSAGTDNLNAVVKYKDPDIRSFLIIAVNQGVDNRLP